MRGFTVGSYMIWKTNVISIKSPAAQQVLCEFRKRARYSMIISEKYLRLRDIPSVGVDPFDGGKFVALAWWLLAPGLGQKLFVLYLFGLCSFILLFVTSKKSNNPVKRATTQICCRCLERSLICVIPAPILSSYAHYKIWTWIWYMKWNTFENPF